MVCKSAPKADKKSEMIVPNSITKILLDLFLPNFFWSLSKMQVIIYSKLSPFLLPLLHWRIDVASSIIFDFDIQLRRKDFWDKNPKWHTGDVMSKKGPQFQT
jgi:hypothetical protein